MLELGVVVVIIGIILSAVGLSWSAVIQARRLAQTQTVLLEAKNCLLERMYYNNTYPSFTSGLDCSGTQNIPEMDVDSCICGLVDAWGQPIYFLSGRKANSPYDPLFVDGTPDEYNFVVNNPAHGQTATNPDQTQSTIIDRSGTTVPYVAFVLISYGMNGVADPGSNYDALLEGAGVRAATLNNTNPPDFTNTTDTTNVGLGVGSDDDIFIVVTGPEIKSYMTAQ